MPRFVGPGFLMPLAVAALLSMTTGQALANHVQCGDPIYQDTTLDSDLIDCPLTGIVIGADDVTLDLNGHTIDGAPGSGDGVYSGDHHGLRVRDGTIQEFRNGVRFETHGNPGPWREYEGGFRYPSTDALGGHIVRGLTVRDNTVSGIDVSGSSHNRIEDNRLYSNRFCGISLTGFASGSAIKRNFASEGFYGIYFEAFGGQVQGNHVSHNLVGGLLGYSLNSRVEENIASGNDGTGIELASHESEVAGNVASGNSWDGIGIGRIGARGATSSRIRKNVVFGNSHDGIALRSEEQWANPPPDHESEENSVEANLVSNNGRHGIFAFTTYGNRFERNRLTGNAATGMTLVFPRRNLIARNVAADNATGGIAVVGRASANEENLIERNSALRNGGAGITTDGFHNRVERNFANSNLGDGILIMNMQANWIEANVANGNGDDGIELNDEAPSLVTRNRANRNRDLGISAIEGVIDGGGNTARGNGNPIQCFNIACR
jgi:parallel beta-helix repeat protein